MLKGRIATSPKDQANARILLEEIARTELAWNRTTDGSNDSGMSICAVVYEDEQEQNAVAAGRIAYDGDACKVEELGVRKEYRGKGYGDFLLRLLVNKAFTSGIKEVECLVPVTLAPFFEKVGFQDKGKEILKDGIKCKNISITMADFTRPCRK